MMLPTVQLIGVQKSGTSSIADWLFMDEDDKDNGGILKRPLTKEDDPPYYSKEVHFFDIGYRFHKGPQFYASRFVQDASSESMDATPDTLQYPARVKTVYDSFNQSNQVKIMVILRDPVEMELSLYNHLVHDNLFLSSSKRNQWHDQVLKKEIGTDGTTMTTKIMTFDEFVDQIRIPALLDERAGEGSGYGKSSQHGLYAYHLTKWFETFDRTNQILVLSYDELRSDPQGLQDRIELFLGKSVKGSITLSNSNDFPQKLSLKDVPVSTKTKLQNVFRKPNEDLYQLLHDQPGPSMEQRPFPKFGSLR